MQDNFPSLFNPTPTMQTERLSFHVENQFWDSNIQLKILTISLHAVLNQSYFVVCVFHVYHFDAEDFT